MTGDEVKAYMYLLCESWLETPRATLPDDDEELSKMAQLSPDKWQKVKPKVMANFALKDGRWINEKLHGVSENQSKFREWGKMGGNPNIIKSEPKQVNPMVNGGHIPLVNLATASSSAASAASEKEERACAKPPPISDDLWERLKAENPGVDIEDEKRKMRTWLIGHPRRKLTVRFITNWINGADRVVDMGKPKNSWDDKIVNK